MSAYRNQRRAGVVAPYGWNKIAAIEEYGGSKPLPYGGCHIVSEEKNISLPPPLRGTSLVRGR